MKDQTVSLQNAQMTTPIFAQAADLGLWFWLAVVLFSVVGTLVAGSLLFFLTRSLFRFGVARLPMLWILGYSGLLAAFACYFAGRWGLLAAAYVWAAYIAGRWRGTRCRA